MTRASSPVNNGKAKIALGDDTALTLSQKGSGNPFDPANYGDIVQPSELFHLVELSPLTLADLPISNLPFSNACERLREPALPRIPKTPPQTPHQTTPPIHTTPLSQTGTNPN